MGTSSSACYDCNDSNEIRRKRNIAKIYFKSFHNIVNILYSISKSKSVCTEIFLISTKSIPNFIKLINDSKILEKIDFRNSEEDIGNLENDFIKYIINYELEKNIKIYSDYQVCKFLIDTENEFIIVGNQFIENMGMDLEITKKKKVILNINKEKKIMQIKFPASQKILDIKQIKIAFFKFINNNIEDKKESFKPYSTIQNSINIKFLKLIKLSK